MTSPLQERLIAALTMLNFSAMCYSPHNIPQRRNSCLHGIQLILRSFQYKIILVLSLVSLLHFSGPLLLLLVKGT